MIPSDLIIKIQPFAIALALGLLIGIERERSHPVGFQPLGLRTFVLFSLLGAIAASLKQPFVALAITMFVGAVVIAGYLRSSVLSSKQPDIGITTEVAAVLTYGLGYLANIEPLIALIVGVFVLAVLLARARLHTFSRTQLRAEELQAATTLLILALGIIPFLPDHTVDTWGLINPQRIGWTILIIGLLQFCGYLGIRFFGAAKGVLLSGFLAGLISSTAATATLSQQVKKGETPAFHASLAVVLATVAMLIKIMVILLIISPKLFVSAGFPMLVVSLLSLVTCMVIGRYTDYADHYPTPKNPLAVMAAIKLAFVLTAMFIVVILTQRYLGDTSTQVLAFLGGLFELQGVSLALATLFHNNQMNAIQATNSFGFAILASFISKYAIVWITSRGRYAVFVSIALGMMVIVFILIWLLIIRI